MKPREIKKLTATLKSVSDPTRRAIFDLILSNEKQDSISTVTKEFKMTRQGITKHLKILEAGGLIELKRIGRVTYCNAQTEALSRIQEWLMSYGESHATKQSPIVQEPEVKYEASMEDINSEEAETVVEEALNIINVEDQISEPQHLEISNQTEETLNDDQNLEEPEDKPQLLQMSIDPEDPGTPVKEEPIKEEPVNKEPKEKPIEVTENQLDIYGIRKEPKANDNQQFELF